LRFKFEMEERRKENIKKRRRKLNWAPDYSFGPTITKTRTRPIPAVALTCGPSPSATPSRAPAFLHVPPFHLHVGPPSQSLLAREQILTGGPRVQSLGRPARRVCLSCIRLVPIPYPRHTTNTTDSCAISTEHDNGGHLASGLLLGTGG
jgi:hypothetical protein